MNRCGFAAGLTMSAIALGCTAQRNEPPVQSGRAVVEAYVSAWNRHDSLALDTLMASDAVHTDIAQNFQGRGPAQTKEFMRMIISTEPDFQWRLTKVIESGPTLAAEWTWTATHTGPSPIGPVTRRRISGPGSSFVEIENGRIKRFTDYYDGASFFREAPAPADTARR
jgi:steroid delta-isomerase-like uncharacterized protein